MEDYILYFILYYVVATALSFYLYIKDSYNLYLWEVLLILVTGYLGGPLLFLGWIFSFIPNIFTIEVWRRKR